MCDAGVLWLQLTGGEPLIDKFFPQVYELAYELGMMISISSNGSRLSSRKILELLTARRPYRLTLSVYGATAESYDGLTRRRGSFAAFTGCNAGHTFFHVDPHGLASMCKGGRDPQIPLMEEGVEGLRRLGAVADSLLLRQGGCTGCTVSGTCGVHAACDAAPQGEGTTVHVLPTLRREVVSMAPVPVEIAPWPVETDEIVFVEDLDALAESSKCSCNAGDDQPY